MAPAVVSFIGIIAPYQASHTVLPYLLYSQAIIYKEIGDKNMLLKTTTTAKDQHRTLLCVHAQTSEQ